VSLSVSKKIAFATVTTVTFVLLLNGLAWVTERGKEGVSFEEKEAMYQTTEKGRRTLRPGAELHGAKQQVNVNSIGFRGPELAEPKPENGYRIWCVGGSTTFDIWAPDDTLTWPAKLQTHLQQRRRDRVIEVINAGIPGELMAGSRDDFEKHFAKVQPDAMVFYHGPNDIREVMYKGPPPVIEGLDQQMALLRGVRNAAQRKLPEIPPEWHGRRLNSHQMILLENTVMELINAARSRGVDVLIVSHALQAENDAIGDEALHGVAEVTLLLQMAPDDVLHTYRDYNGMLRGIAEREGLPFADLRERMPSYERFWGDSLHFSALGSDVAGRFLTDAFIETDWL